ncbi:hypothetical protein TrST_g455 [Triparma strigata]|uniref:Uncharacterized protein n=1 Tax=Triparma strigata TaxID=1606541 RepID=A0A9W7B7H1_9STRA|nr:hypothetical protein TrST_g455 [Triparma strigata]
MPSKPPVPRETHAEIRCVSSLLPNAIGSCEVSMNETMVMAAVHGPLAPRSDDREYSDEGKLSISLKFAPFTNPSIPPNQSTSSRMTPSESLLAASVRSALLPSLLLANLKTSMMSVHLEVLQDNGLVFEAAVTCASLALADAGVEMMDMVSCCTVSLHGSDVMVMDPSTSESDGEDGRVTIALMASTGNVNMYEQKGSLGMEELKRVSELAKKGCKELTVSTMRRAILSSS